MSTSGYWSRLRSRNLSRRALLRASARAGVGAAGLALVGCGDDDDDGDVPSAVQADRQQQQQDQPARQDQDQRQQQDQGRQQQQDDDQERQADRQAQQQDQQEAPGEQQQDQATADDGIDYNATAIGAYGSFPQILDQGSALARGGQAASNGHHFSSFFPLDKQGSSVPGGLAEWEFIGGEALIVTVNDGRSSTTATP